MNNGDNEEDTESEEEQTEMTTATATKPTAAARIVEVLGNAENPLTVEQISKLTEIKPTTLERALRKMTTNREVRKTTVDHLAHYGLPPTTQTKGQIAGQVVEFLEAHPGEMFSPYMIAKNIGRGSGSVAWTCQAMERRGELVRASDKPVCYVLPA